MSRKDTIEIQAARDVRFTEVMRCALTAGEYAGNYCQPTAMKVFQHGTDPAKGEIVNEGVCGFAWVSIKPATSSFCKWLKSLPDNHELKESIGIHRGYYGGLELWCQLFGQSHERKRAWAKAVAKVLQNHGIDRAFADDRLD